MLCGGRKTKPTSPEPEAYPPLSPHHAAALRSFVPACLNTYDLFHDIITPIIYSLFLVNEMKRVWCVCACFTCINTKQCCGLFRTKGIIDFIYYSVKCECFPPHCRLLLVVRYGIFFLLFFFFINHTVHSRYKHAV